MLISWNTGDVRLALDAPADGPVRLLGIRSGPEPERWPAGAALVEVALAADGRTWSANGQHRRYATSLRLRYEEHRADEGSLTITQRDPETGLRFTTYVRGSDGARVVRMHTEVRNDGTQPQRIAFLSTFALTGFVEPPARAFPDALFLHFAYNAWDAEFRWQRFSLERAGLVDIGPHGSSRAHFSVCSAGTWSTGGHLPMGAVENVHTGHVWAWQIEHNGGWQWQASDGDGDVHIAASGPTDREHHWSVTLHPGASFTTVPAAIAASPTGLGDALGELTRHRRLIRRPNEDNRTLPVIFNDYMNCLNGDPSTEKLLPLIDAAAAAGAEYFVIDAGWYSDRAGWWDSVGEWRASTTRFPGGGLGAVIERIHAAGMRPGLWLEPEVVGVQSPIAATLPEDAFFQRDGERIVDNGRFQLDYRHPAVISRMDGVVDELMSEYRLGYFKFDYNISPGLGTEAGGVDLGHGLLEHNVAFAAWLDGLFARYPDLVIENCSSGGMRVDYRQLARLSIQSTSDQTDPLRYVPIAAAAPSAVTPEQGAIWAYPQPNWSDDVNALTMVNALLGRIHLSGRLDLLDERQMAMVTDAISVYKGIRDRLPTSLPFWPLGLPGWYDPWCSLGLGNADELLIALWRRGGENMTQLPLPQNRSLSPEILFGADARLDWDPAGARLAVTLPAAPSACLLRLTA